MPTGAITVEALGKLTKRWAGKGAIVLDDKLNKAPEGFLGAFPVDTGLESQYFEIWNQKGNPGTINGVLDGPGKTTAHKYVRSYKDMHNAWDKYDYEILDSAVTEVAANRLAKDGTQHGLNYFRQTRVWKILTELKAKRATANYHAALKGVWGVSGQGAGQADIVKAIMGIVSTTGIDPNSVEFGVAYPSKVMDEFASLNLINMVVQRLDQYMKAAWKLDPFAITPYQNDAGESVIDIDGETSSNVLGTSALVFVKGQDTLRVGEYRPSDIMLNETTRIEGTSWKNLFKQCVVALAPSMDGTENGKNKYIYEVTGVTT
jgi:hypothetical protein